MPDKIASDAALPAVAVVLNETIGTVSISALTIYVPVLFPSVNSTEAFPCKFVIPTLSLSFCPVAFVGIESIANFTQTPLTGFSPISLTETVNSESNFSKIGLV